MNTRQVPGPTPDSSHPLHSLATALQRLVSVNRTMTSLLETSSAPGSSTPMHFLFPVKNPFPTPAQDRRSVV